MNPTGYLVKWGMYLILFVILLALGETLFLRFTDWFARTTADAKRRAKETE